MAKYVYPAIFTPEENGMFSVSFPDLENCFTCGNDLADALEMASDVLALCLCELEDEHEPVPKPSIPTEITLEAGELVSFVLADTTAYRAKLARRRVHSHRTRIPQSKH